MRQPRDTLHGTLDLLVLRSLADGEAYHGTAIVDRIAEGSADALSVEEGSLYPALHRMEEAGWLTSKWNASENNRRARYYRITRKGRQQLARATRRWTAHVDAVRRVLKMA
jgi:transcriptional regulator